MQGSHIAQADPVLRPFMEAATEEDSTRHLDRMIREYAEPLARRIVNRKYHGALRPARRYHDEEACNAEDACATALLHVVARLRTERQRRGTAAIQDFRAYVAVTASRACDQQFRRNSPLRNGLSYRIREILSGQAHFALWKADGRWIGGRVEWNGRAADARAMANLSAAESDTASFRRAVFPDEDPTQMELDGLLAALLRHAGGPIELNALVSVVASLRDIREASAGRVPEDEDLGDPLERIADTRVDIAAECEHRVVLQGVWDEIRQLRREQRSALLLNLRDGAGRGVLALFTHLGIATMEDIAAILEIPVREMVALWKDLPLEDAEIAERLGVTRQQVINLRKCARERLSRRLRAAGLHPFEPA